MFAPVHSTGANRHILFKMGACGEEGVSRPSLFCAFILEGTELSDVFFSIGICGIM